MIKSRPAGLVCLLILGMALLQGCSTMANIPLIKELPFVSKAEEESAPATPSSCSRT